VIGCGVAGLGAAYTLTRAPGTHVTLYEARAVLGGHANTVDVPLPDGSVLPVDTGFLVYNENTYPNLCGLFEVRKGAAVGLPAQLRRWLQGALCSPLNSHAPPRPPLYPSPLPTPSLPSGAGRAHGAL
jgi:hypothetical protein